MTNPTKFPVQIRITGGPFPYDVRVEDENGRDLAGVAAIRFEPIEPGSVVRASVTLAAALNVQAVATWLVAHPVTGELKEIKRIEFADGDVIEAVGKLDD